MTQFFTDDQRPDLVRRYVDEAEDVWPTHMQFVYHDPVCEAFWPRLKEEFPAYQFIVYDDSEDRFLAQGNTIPFQWTGRDEDLPDGVPTVLEKAFGEAAEHLPATSLCALLAGIQPMARSKGLSVELLQYMKQIARRHGLSSLAAPVRPTLKERYPLIPIERYVEWRRDDGLMFDPWLRTHERIGAHFAGIAPMGNVYRGTVSTGNDGPTWRFPSQANTSCPERRTP